MGALYEGRDTRLADSPCAIKAMLPQSEQLEDYVRNRFKEEMRMLSGLNHPGIPRIRDSFVEGHAVYIVMDLVRGRNLAQILHESLEKTGKGLPAAQVVEIGMRILDVLEYLHGQSPPIIHRDIKPANIIEDENGLIKLVDFGLACDNTVNTRTSVGTLGYCPLEQMRGKVVTQSDIFALGVTLHHLLSGKVPAPMSLEPLAKLRPDLPLVLIGAINTATARAAEDRHANAAAFREALQRASVSKARVRQEAPEEDTMVFEGPVPFLDKSPRDVETPIIIQAVPATPSSTWLLPGLAVTMMGLSFMLWMGVSRPAPTASPSATPSLETQTRESISSTPVPIPATPEEFTAPTASAQPPVQRHRVEKRVVVHTPQQVVPQVLHLRTDNAPSVPTANYTPAPPSRPLATQTAQARPEVVVTPRVVAPTPRYQGPPPDGRPHGPNYQPPPGYPTPPPPPPDGYGPPPGQNNPIHD